MKKKSESRTLLMSVIMSAPGPLVVGLGLLAGKSSTQLADFFRRSAELLAIICSFVVFQMTNKDGICDVDRKAKLERRSNQFVGGMMCLSGTIMVGLAFFAESTDKGNVIPGLSIALMGVVANTLFWRKYTKLNKLDPNPIISVQARLYRAKALVDTCVTIALLSVAVFPEATLSAWLDLIGSVIVAVYLIWCGIQTLRENT